MQPEWWRHHHSWHPCVMSKHQQASVSTTGHPWPTDIDSLLQDSGRVVVVTGAGCSTESNIPDYRGPNGAYNTGFKPMTHQQVGCTQAQSACLVFLYLPLWRSTSFVLQDMIPGRRLLACNLPFWDLYSALSQSLRLSTMQTSAHRIQDALKNLAALLVTFSKSQPSWMRPHELMTCMQDKQIDAFLTTLWPPIWCKFC